MTLSLAKPFHHPLHLPLLAVFIAFVAVVLIPSSIAQATHGGPTGWTDCGQSLYVANEGNGGGGSTIMRVDCNGHAITFANGFMGPSGLVADSTYLYISDDSPALWTVDSSGTRSAIATTATVSNPNGLALDASGRLITADAGLGAVRRITMDGSGNVVTDELLATGFNNPQGVIVVPSSGDILFSDQDGYIYRIQSSTTLPVTHPATTERLAVGNIASSNEGSIKLDASENIYLSNFGGDIYRVDPTGTTSKAVVSVSNPDCDPTQSGHNGEPGWRGMVFSPDGDLVVTAYCFDSIYVFPLADLDNAWTTNTPISALPTVFSENPSGAYDTPYFNGPFGIAFFDADVPPIAEACTVPTQGLFDTIWVDVNGPSSTPDGSPAAPYLTIQDGVDNAASGDIVRVRPGVYVENVTVSTSEIYIIGDSTSNPEIHGAPLTLSGMTISQFVTDIAVMNLRFKKALGEGSGYVAGIIVYGSQESRDIDICNNVFMENDAGVATQNASPTVINNTFVNNIDAGITTSSTSEAIIRNNIFQGNGDGVRSNSGIVTVDHNLFYTNTADFGGTATCGAPDGCVFAADPLLMDIAADDYHITGSSPAIDVGSETLAPADDFDADARPLDGDGDTTATTDIGADEYSDDPLMDPPPPESTATPTPVPTAVGPTSTPVPTSTPAPEVTPVPGLTQWAMIGLTGLFALVIIFRASSMNRRRRDTGSR